MKKINYKVADVIFLLALFVILHHFINMHLK